MTSSALVVARGIRKSFGPTQVLKGVDFAIHAGEIHALLGGNGAGKSTLIKILTGIVPRDSGDLSLDGQPRSLDNVHKAASTLVAVVHQEMALLPHLSVAENIALPQARRALAVVDAAAVRAKALDALTLIDEEFAHRALDQAVARLSLHERQLVEIARTLASGARLLFLDEPTANLTAAESQRLFEVLRRLVQVRRIGVVFVSHRMREIREIAHVCSILRNGTTVVDRLPLDQLTDADIVERMGQGDAARAPHAVTLGVRAPVEAKDAVRLECEAMKVHIAPGSVLGLAGAPAGPSALIDQLVGAAGARGRWHLAVRDRVLDTRSPRKALAAGVGYVSGDRANKGLLLSLPIIDNLMASRRVRQGDIWVRAAEQVEAQRLMDGLSVKGHLWQLPSALSGGTQQKLLIARWTQLAPSVLVLEEPTRGVDIGTKKEIYAQIRALAAHGTTVIWWSTENVELKEVCDLALAFDPDGQPTALLAHEELTEERLADATGMAA
ncbi:ATP-binding cassette domain-containing protein [Pseudacidovorax intermedius]|nr:sugar ABC transporter ATP-binding protein [Pseudacidovorax intermedius]